MKKRARRPIEQQQEPAPATVPNVPPKRHWRERSKPPKEKRTGVVKKLCADRKLARTVFRMRARGIPLTEISHRLGRDYNIILKAWNEGFADYDKGTDVIVRQSIVETIARYDCVLRTTSVRALGGKLRDATTGKVVLLQPEAKWMLMHLRALRDFGTLIRPAQLQQVNMQFNAAAQTPTADTPLAMSEREAAKLMREEADRFVREEFAGNIAPKALMPKDVIIDVAPGQARIETGNDDAVEDVKNAADPNRRKRGA